MLAATWSLRPDGHSLDSYHEYHIGLKPLSCDKYVMEMCQYVSSVVIQDNKTYKDGLVDTNAVSSEASEDCEDSDDSEFDVGDEDRIKDVEVDMDDFRKHTDENVEWVECNEEEVQVPPPFDYEEVDLEDFGSGTEKWYLSFCGSKRQLWFTRNDKTRMRAECRGLVYVFGNGPGDSGLGVGDGGPGLIHVLQETFPAAEHRFCLKHIYDNLKLQWRGEQYKDLLWRCATATTVQRFGKNMKEIKKFDPEMYKWLKDIPPQHWARKWEITGMPCKHAVACIWDMANNGLEPGIPESWVHESYWLKTWEEMYRFKINPCNGPDMWPESDTPITLTLLSSFTDNYSCICTSSTVFNPTFTSSTVFNPTFISFIIF
ncbi:mutator type transposase [Tanacetum coccineum]